MKNKDLRVIKMALEGAQKQFRERVESIAEHAREAILSYFSKHRLTYKAGNGTWFIDRGGQESVYDRGVSDEDLPATIRELLWLEVEYAQPLGYFIADIREEDWTS